MKTTISRIMLFATVAQIVSPTIAFAQEKEAVATAKPVAQDNDVNNVRLNVGDVLKIIVPGEDAFNTLFKINRDGRIELPEVGGVEVKGLTIDEAKVRVKASLATAYQGLNKFNLILHERRVIVKVLGFVKQPGDVEMSEHANIQQAITSAGGIRQGAQLDRMQLRRNGKVQIFDYKKYLDTGDTTSLPKLESLDELFIPSSPSTGNVEIEFDPRSLQAAGDAADGNSSVRVFGEVNSQSTFSWKENMHVMDALLRAGGVTRYAGVEQIKVLLNGEAKVFNLNKFTEENDPKLNFILPKGAIIYVPASVEGIKHGKHTVYVMGEAAKPGANEAQDGVSFLDILSTAGGPTRFAETKQIRILRADGTVEPFDLFQYSEKGGGKLPLMHPGDALFIPEKQNDGEQKSWLKTPADRSVRVMGSVRSPGRLEWSDEMSIMDLLAQVGGPNDKGDTSKIQILDPDGKPKIFNLQEFIDKGGLSSALPVIHAGTTVTVPLLPESPNDTRATWTRLASDRAIHVLGDVGRPGRYAITPEMSFLDVISAADGPTPNADILNISVNHRGEGKDHNEKVNLAKYFATGDDTLLPKVRAGDVIFVPDRNRNWLETAPKNTVKVLGAVGKPGRYTITPDMTILDLLAEAGGPTTSALQSKIIVANVTAGDKNASVFDLPKFATTGDFTTLPTVRTGDIVYVPNSEQSDWNLFFGDVRDVLSAVAIVALLKGL